MSDGFHPDRHLPDCMLPDGGDCCSGHQAVCEDWHKQRTTIASLRKALEAERERCAAMADGMARIGRQLIADNNAYEKRSGNSAADANKFCELRVSVSEEIAGYIRALAPPQTPAATLGKGEA